MIRIGLLGAAKIAPPAIIDPVSKRGDCVVTAVAARDIDRAAEFCEAHGIDVALSDYNALVARDDVDLVYNALPPHRHADLTIAALKAGKAVLCEKPFAMNAHQAKAMVAAAAETGGALVEAFHHRYHPAFLRVLDIVNSGEIGEIASVSAAFNAHIPYRRGELRHTLAVGGGALMDLGCYPVHWARSIIGGVPQVVEATANCAHEPDVDTRLEAMLAFPSGVMAGISTNMEADAGRAAHLTVEGTGGTLHMVNPIHPYLGHDIAITRGGTTRHETVPGGPTYDYQLAHVLAQMRGEAASLTGGSDAVENMVVIDAIYRAAGLPLRGED